MDIKASIGEMWDKGYALGFNHGFRTGWVQAESMLSTVSMEHRLSESIKLHNKVREEGQKSVKYETLS